MRKIFSKAGLIAIGMWLAWTNPALAQVGVGTTQPTARFHIAGQPFPSTNGEVLRIDNMPDANAGINNAIVVRQENGAVRQIRGTAAGQALIWNGDRWVLSNPSGVDVQGAAPITVTGGPFPFTVGLATGQGPGFWFYNGTAWEWVTDLTGAFVPVAPIYIDGVNIGLTPGNAIGQFYQWSGNAWELGGGGAATVWQVLRWDTTSRKWIPGSITGSCILNVGVSGNDLVVGFNAGNATNRYLIYWNNAANCWDLGSFDTPFIENIFNQKITNYITNNFNTIFDTILTAGPELTLSDSAPNIRFTPCPDSGQVRMWNGTAWVCANLPSSTTVLPTCSNGQTLVYNGVTGQWVCASVDTIGVDSIAGRDVVCVQPLAGGGVSVGLCPCPDGFTVVYDTSSGTWQCGPATANIITDSLRISAQAPIGLVPNPADTSLLIRLNPCPDGQTYVWNGATNAWECRVAAVVNLNNADVVVNSPLTLDLNIVEGDTTLVFGLRTCAEGQVLAYVGGAWVCRTIDMLAFPTCADNQVLVYDDPDGDSTGTWVCADFPQLSTCAEGQILVYRSGAWVCENNPATNISATAPLNAVTVGDTSTISINNGTANGDLLIWNASTNVWEIRQPIVTSWQLTGNDANATDFIGTINPVAFTVRTNNVPRMRVNPNGQVQVNFNQDVVSTTGVSQGVDDVLQVLSASFPNNATFVNNAIHGRGGSKNSVGILGTNASSIGTGVVGIGNGLPFYGIDGQPIFATNFVSQGAGVIGLGEFTGIKGLAMATAGGVESFGVYGETRSATDGAVGVFGDASNSEAILTYGVVGVTSAENSGTTNSSIGEAIYSAGVLGQSYGSDAINYGVIGETYSRIGNSAGVLGISDVNPAGPQYGVVGQTYSGYENAAGVYGDASVNNGMVFGVFGQTRSGSDGAAGVYGYGYNAAGMNYGVLGSTFSQTDGAAGVAGILTSPGTAGSRSFAVKAQNLRPGPGVNVGLMASAANGAENYAIWSNGNVWSNGVVGGSLKTFRLDHPLDPANKYLIHASVESNEAVNVYTGNITTDAAGLAVVTLPDYVEAVNKDFRYQLTVIGRFANAIVKEKVSGGKFVIQTDQPGIEVSWTLTGVRNDKFIQAYPMTAEQDKGALRGKYIHPELFGQSPESGIMYQPQPVLPEGGVDFKYTPARKVFKNRSGK